MVIEAKIDEAIEELDSTTAQIRSAEDDDDSESDASDSTEDSYDDICAPASNGMEHVTALRRHLKSTNASKELNILLTQFEKNMRAEQAARCTLQPNLLNLWAKK